MHTKIIALVGRPNVGKSTLFNRLAVQTKAIIHNQSGVTRDRKYGSANIGGIEFTIIDTPGLEESADGALEHRMMQQTIAAIIESDIVFFIVDNHHGITPTDKAFAHFVRQHSDNVLLIANKSEKNFLLHKDYYQMGFGAPMPISAQHGNNIIALHEEMIDKFDARNLQSNLEKIQSQATHKSLVAQPSYNNAVADNNISESLQRISSTKSKKKASIHNAISIVIAGRPNAGKSTFVNALIGSERMLTGPEAGITRESIEITWKYNGYAIKLIDSAGLRKRANIDASLEKLSASDTIESINFANIVILMLDATIALEMQDLIIANYTIDQGRGLVIVVNKSDLIDTKREYKEEFAYKLQKSLPQLGTISPVYISSLKKHNITQVIDQAIIHHAKWNTKITTRKLNNWLLASTQKHTLPMQKKLGRRVKLKYITQIKTRPPTFKLFTNDPNSITSAYKKYLLNDLRSQFNMHGIPIRLLFTKSDNPYGN